MKTFNIVLTITVDEGTDVGPIADAVDELARFNDAVFNWDVNITEVIKEDE